MRSDRDCDVGGEMSMTDEDGGVELKQMDLSIHSVSIGHILKVRSKVRYTTFYVCAGYTCGQ